MNSRTHRLVLALLAVFALAFLVAPAMASSDVTGKIIADVAADGHVDGHYTSSQLHAALASPLLRQYGGNGAVQGVQAALGHHTTTPVAHNAVSPGTGTSPAGTLPFTGADIALFVIVGGSLLVAGFVLRRMGRRGDDGTPSI